MQGGYAMPNRRQFMETVLEGTAAVAASGLLPANRILGANDRVRFGLIGCGGRGTEILRSALRCTNTECIAVADVYTRRLEQVKRYVPGARQYGDFRRMLEGKS